MTNKAAIDKIKCFPSWNLDDGWLLEEEMQELSDMAILALEKQMPKKPDFELNLSDYISRFICKCGKKIIVRHDSGVMDNHDAPNYCPDCGQALDSIE